MADKGSTALSSPDPKIPTTHALNSVSGPFIGVAGRSFLMFCLWLGMISSRLRRRRAQNTGFADRLSAWRPSLNVKAGVYSSLGTGSCIVAAAVLTRIFYASSFKSTLPLLFLGIIVLVTVVFGREAGVLGNLGAALIFASVLFEPRPSLAIQDPTAQTHLIWMIVIGIVVTDLLGRRKSTQRPR